LFPNFFFSFLSSQSILRPFFLYPFIYFLPSNFSSFLSPFFHYFIKLGVRRNAIKLREIKKTMEDGKIVKQGAEWKPHGKRKRGGPINTWKDGIRESMKAKGRRMYGSRSLEKKNHVFGLRKTVYPRKNS
jgi:hypothetical protein